MIFDTSKTFKTNNRLWNSFAATCKLRNVSIPERISELILSDVEQHKLVSTDSLFPAGDNNASE